MLRVSICSHYHSEESGWISSLSHQLFTHIDKIFPGLSFLLASPHMSNAPIPKHLCSFISCTDVPQLYTDQRGGHL